MGYVDPQTGKWKPDATDFAEVPTLRLQELRAERDLYKSRYERAVQYLRQTKAWLEAGRNDAALGSLSDSLAALADREKGEG